MRARLHVIHHPPDAARTQDTKPGATKTRPSRDGQSVRTQHARGAGAKGNHICVLVTRVTREQAACNLVCKGACPLAACSYALCAPTLIPTAAHEQ